MKRNRLKKGLKIGILTLFSGATAFAVVLANNYKQEYAETQAVSYDDNSYTINLNANELNNYTWENLLNYIPTINIYPNMIYNSNNYNDEDSDNETAYYDYRYTGNIDIVNVITLNKEFSTGIANSKFNYYTFENGDNIYTKLTFEYNLTIDLSNYTSVYNNYKQAIELDIQANKPTVITTYQANYSTFTYLAEQINENATSSDFENSYIMYNGNKYEYDVFTTNDGIIYEYENNQIMIGLATNTTEYAKIKYYDENGDEQPFNNNLYIYNCEFIAENLNAPFESGSIVNTIESGLGIISDLAVNFLNGFTTLFWDSTNNSLTNFSIFSFVMLGLSISIAVVSLCMRVVRNNTGA